MKKIAVKGFTLIELLVVIAIIALLASIILASLTTARGKGRDANRVSSLQQMARAVAIVDEDPSPLFTGCVGASAKANTCTGVTGTAFATDWANYRDPQVGFNGAACGGATKGAVAAARCQYTIGTNTALGAAPGAGAKTQNYKICTVLETGNMAFGGAAGTDGSVHVSSDSGGSVMAGC